MSPLFKLGKSRPQLTRDAVHADVPELRGANMAAVYYGQRMGGDFYDFLRVSPKRVLFGLLDVAGRQEENHDIVSAAQQTFRTLGAELFAKEDINEAEAMIEVCLQLNRTILETAGGVHSCPAFAGCYDENLGTVCYFNAGHTPGLVRDTTGVAELPATGLPLGLFSHSTCDASTVALEPGAVLMLVSRGIVEAKSGGQEWGLDSVKDGFQRSTAVGAKEFSLSILDQLQQFMHTPPTHNDVTALTLARDSRTAGD
ncbi:MAG: SpoIIE family protein phosphatase [Terriglobales bacterium]|jgi:serine phosphatase RsbU (regulator of sigma subunit)